VTLWDATNPASPALRASLAGIAGTLGVTFSPDGRTLATVGPGSVVLWNVSVPGVPTTLAKPSTSGGATTLAFSPDGSTLATAGNGSGVDLWNAPQPASLTEIAASDSPSARRHHARLRVLALGSGAGATIWDIAEPQVPRLLSTIKPDVASGPASLLTETEGLAIDPSGHLLAIASLADVSLWSLGNPSHPVLLKTIADTTAIGPIAFSPRGHLLAISDAQHITLWDVTDPARDSPARTTGKISLPDALAFSPSGQQLAFSTAASSAQGWLWTFTSTAAPTRLPALAGCGLACAIYALAFSPDGHTLAEGTLAARTSTRWAASRGSSPGQQGRFPPWLSAPTGGS